MKHISTKTAKQVAIADMKKSNVKVSFLYNEKLIKEMTKVLSLDDYEQLASL